MLDHQVLECICCFFCELTNEDRAFTLPAAGYLGSSDMKKLHFLCYCFPNNLRMCDLKAWNFENQLEREGLLRWTVAAEPESYHHLCRPGWCCRGSENHCIPNLFCLSRAIVLISEQRNGKSDLCGLLTPDPGDLYNGDADWAFGFLV